jgi:hypothetical protein
MLLLIINKILFILLILSILNVARNLFFTSLEWFKEETQKAKIKMTSLSLLLLGLSIAYIIASIFTGVSL